MSDDLDRQILDLLADLIRRVQKLEGGDDEPGECVPPTVSPLLDYVGHVRAFYNELPDEPAAVASFVYGVGLHLQRAAEEILGPDGDLVRGIGQWLEWRADSLSIDKRLPFKAWVHVVLTALEKEQAEPGRHSGVTFAELLDALQDGISASYGTLQRVVGPREGFAVAKFGGLLTAISWAMGEVQGAGEMIPRDLPDEWEGESRPSGPDGG